MKKIILTLLKSFFFVSLLIVLQLNTLLAQICTSYMLVPDTADINTTYTFEVQPATGGSVPPSLWLCQWIDFEANGSQECTNTPACAYTFTSGGLLPVIYQINEPFLGNTEVCTSYVFVNACDAGLDVSVNNVSDTVGVCYDEDILLVADLQDSLSCTGTWQYAWFDGNFYYDGTGFLSVNEVWLSNVPTLLYNNISTNRTFKVKTRCSVFPNCKDSSAIHVFIKQNVTTPIFQPLPDTSRCADYDTLNINAIAPNADSLIYSIDAQSMAAGNSINKYTGMLIFDSLYTGTTIITATVYGCDGPKTASLTIKTWPYPSLTILSNDTSHACFGSNVYVPIQLSGTLPQFTLMANFDTVTHYQWSLLTNNYTIGFLNIHFPEMLIEFYYLADKNCTTALNQSHLILASPLPLINTLPDTTLCPWDTITLDAGSGPYQYLWLTDNSTASSITIDTSSTGIGMGSNPVILEVNNEHCTLRDTIIITFTVCASLNTPESAFDFEVYPNPSSGVVQIVLPETEKLFQIDVYNALGQCIFDFEINPLSTNQQHIQLYDKGLYFLRCTTHEGKSMTKKLIVE